MAWAHPSLEDATRQAASGANRGAIDRRGFAPKAGSHSALNILTSPRTHTRRGKAATLAVRRCVRCLLRPHVAVGSGDLLAKLRLKLTSIGRSIRRWRRWTQIKGHTSAIESRALVPLSRRLCQPCLSKGLGTRASTTKSVCSSADSLLPQQSAEGANVVACRSNPPDANSKTLPAKFAPRGVITTPIRQDTCS
jgi:hypothetical protein